MTDELSRSHAIDVPEEIARTTITITPAPPETVDHSTPPSIDVEVSTERDGIEVVLVETLLADDVDRLVSTLKVARGQAIREAEAAGYFAWVEAGRPARWPPL